MKLPESLQKIAYKVRLEQLNKSDSESIWNIIRLGQGKSLVGLYVCEGQFRKLPFYRIENSTLFPCECISIMCYTVTSTIRKEFSISCKYHEKSGWHQRTKANILWFVDEQLIREERSDDFEYILKELNHK